MKRWIAAVTLLTLANLLPAEIGHFPAGLTGGMGAAFAAAPNVVGTYSGTWDQDGLLPGATVQMTITSETPSGTNQVLNGHFDWNCGSVYVCSGREVFTGILYPNMTFALTGTSLINPVNIALTFYSGTVSSDGLTISGVFGVNPPNDIDGHFYVAKAGASFTPQVGLWWNPAESGSGYALDYKHGVLVVTIYSYATNGAAQWYLASGPVTNNVFTATLDRYTSGQCISCVYPGRPQQPGNDGAIKITFTSPITATMQLPGGRNFQIVPQDF